MSRGFLGLFAGERTPGRGRRLKKFDAWQLQLLLSCNASGAIIFDVVLLYCTSTMSRLTRDGTAEPVSRDQILRPARGQGNTFPLFS